MRRVKTPGGAKYYDLPVGSPITADAILKARAKNGGKRPPKNATYTSSAPRSGGAPSSPTKAPTDANFVSSAPKQTATQRAASAVTGRRKVTANDGTANVLVKTKLKGPIEHQVGDHTYHLPEGSQVFTSKKTNVSYVIDDKKQLHVLTPDGEVKISPATEERLRESVPNSSDHQEIETQGETRGQAKGFGLGAEDTPESATTGGRQPTAKDKADAAELHKRQAEIDAKKNDAPSATTGGRQPTAKDKEEAAALHKRQADQDAAKKETPATPTSGRQPTDKDKAEAAELHARQEKQDAEKKETPATPTSGRQPTDKDKEEAAALHARQEKQDSAKETPSATTGGRQPTDKDKADAAALHADQAKKVAAAPPQGRTPEQQARLDELDAERDRILSNSVPEKQTPTTPQAELRSKISEQKAAAKDLESSAKTDTRMQSLAVAQRAQVARMEMALAEIKGEGPHTAPLLPQNEAGRPIRKPDSLGTPVVPNAEEVEALTSSPYTSKHVNEKGEFTPERQKVHEQIINDFLDGIQPVANPTQYMNGGGPASGKGSMTKGKNAELTNYPTSRGVDDLTGEIDKSVATPGALLIDPDAIKMQLPEVKEALARLNAGGDELNDMMWAGHSHEESSQLSKRLHSAALDRGINIIYDGTGNGSVGSVMSKVKAARDNGYRVEANYLTLAPEEGIGRAAERAARSKRIVPDAQIRKTYAALPEIFDGVKTGVFDKVNLFDNNVERGKPATLVGSGSGDNFEIHDQGAYDKFMKSRHSAGIPDPADKKATATYKAQQAAKKSGSAQSTIPSDPEAYAQFTRARQDMRDANAAKGFPRAQGVPPVKHDVTLSNGLTVSRNSPGDYTHAVVATKPNGAPYVAHWSSSGQKALDQADRLRSEGATGVSVQSLDNVPVARASSTSVPTNADELAAVKKSVLQKDLATTDSAKRSQGNGADPKASKALGESLQDYAGLDAVNAYFGDKPLGKSGVTAKFQGTGRSISGRFYDKDGKSVGRFERQLDGDSIIHQQVEIDPSAKGQGIITDFNREMEAAYKASGIKQIKLTAGLNDGGRVWAKAGYDWDTEGKRGFRAPRNWKFNGPMKRTDEEGQAYLKALDASFVAATHASQDYASGKITLEERDAIIAKVPRPWEIVNVKHTGFTGDDILNGSEWEGIKKL